MAQSLYAIDALAVLNVTLGIALILLIRLNYAYAIGPRLPLLQRL